MRRHNRSVALKECLRILLPVQRLLTVLTKDRETIIVVLSFQKN